MLKLLPALLITLLAVNVSVAQTEDNKPYVTSGGELIFSMANISDNGADIDPVVRFSGFFNLQSLLNYDFNSSAGVFTGLSIKNIGFIFDVPNSNQRKKVRTYNLGIPIGFKIGNLDKIFIYGGYELEIPLNYKEKTFINDEKDDKFNTWFSKRTNTFMSSAFIGLQLPYGANVKFKYYFTNFFNQDYTAEDENGVPYKPYEGFEANIFYFSLSFDLFKDHDFYHSKNGSTVL
jgi:hypothetical protein